MSNSEQHVFILEQESFNVFQRSHIEFLELAIRAGRESSTAHILDIEWGTTN